MGRPIDLPSGDPIVMPELEALEVTGLEWLVTRGSWSANPISGHYSALSRYKPGSEYRREIQVSGTALEAPRPIIYGTRQIAGTILDMEVSTAGTGPYTNLIHIWFFLCEGPVSSITNIEVNGTPIGSAAWVQSYSTYLGADTQSVDTFLTTSSYPGSAGVRVSVRLEESRSPGFPTLTATVAKGSLTDWDGVTRSARNPIAQMFEYMTNAEYGMGEDPANFHSDSWNDSADWAEALVGGEERFGCDIILTGLRDEEVLQQIGLHCFAYEPFLVDGLWRIACFRDLTTDVVSLTADDMLAVSKERFTPISARPHGVRVGYIDPDDWSSQTILAGDYGSRVISISLPGCTSRSMAARWGEQHKGLIDGEKQHFKTVAPPSAIDVLPGDGIEFTPRNGSAARYRVKAPVILHDDGSIELEIQSYDASAQSSTTKGARTSPLLPSKFVGTSNPAIVGLTDNDFLVGSDTEQTTASSSFQTVATLSRTLGFPTYYRLAWNCECRHDTDNSQVEVQARYQLNGGSWVEVSLDQHDYSPADEWQSMSGFGFVNVAAGDAILWQLRFRDVTGAGTAKIRRARLVVECVGG